MFFSKFLSFFSNVSINVNFEVNISVNSNSLWNSPFWKGFVSYWDQSVDIQCWSVGWFMYEFQTICYVTGFYSIFATHNKVKGYSSFYEAFKFESVNRSYLINSVYLWLNFLILLSHVFKTQTRLQNEILICVFFFYAYFFIRPLNIKLYTMNQIMPLNGSFCTRIFQH